MAAPTVGAILKDLLPYLEVPGEPEPMCQTESYLGMDLKTAEQTARAQGLNIKITGQGSVVTGQIPTPGRQVPAGSEILLYFDENPQNTDAG